MSGVDFYNDSKATNVDATLKALDAFQGGLWVILGGKDKGSDYTVLRAPLAAKARAALLIGAAAEKIARQLGGAVPLVRRRHAGGSRPRRPTRAAGRATPSCWRPPAPASTSSAATSTAAACSKTWYGNSNPRSEHMAQRLKTDWILFFTVLAMVSFGLVFVYSASSIMAQWKFHSPWHFVRQQAGAAVVAVAMHDGC